MVYITYNEAITLLYLSQLIYDYNSNDKFDVLPNETISDFIKRINIDSNNYDYIREPLFYLLNVASDGKIIKHISNSDTNTHVAIIVSDKNKNIAIVFKGSTTINDYYFNINLFSKQIKNFSVHTGFYNQVCSVKNQIFNLIKPYIEKNYSLYLTGHSSGSANATLLSYFINEKYPNTLIKLVTFGGPKIGNAEWRKCFENKQNIIHYRITNKSDIITYVPIINYYHVGKHIYISNNELYYNYKNNENTCFLDNCSLSKSFNVDDHHMLNYVKNMVNKKHMWNKLYEKININNELNDELNNIRMIYE